MNIMMDTPELFLQTRNLEAPHGSKPGGRRLKCADTGVEAAFELTVQRPPLDAIKVPTSVNDIGADARLQCCLIPLPDE